MVTAVTPQGAPEPGRDRPWWPLVVAVGVAGVALGYLLGGGPANDPPVASETTTTTFSSEPTVPSGPPPTPPEPALAERVPGFEGTLHVQLNWPQSLHTTGPRLWTWPAARRSGLEDRLPVMGFASPDAGGGYGGEVNHLFFGFDTWTVLVYDYTGGAAMTDEQPATWARTCRAGSHGGESPRFGVVDLMDPPGIGTWAVTVECEHSMSPEMALGCVYPLMMPHAAAEGFSRSVATLSPREAWPSFDRFYESHYGRAVGIAFAFCGSRSVSEELAQDAFLAAFRHWDRVAQLDNPGAWLRRVLVNVSVSRFRRLRAESRALLRLDRRATHDGHDELAAAMDVWREVRRLPRRQAQVVVLTYVDGLSRRQVGEVMGCGEETVKTHLERARRTREKRLEVRGERGEHL